MSQTETRLQQDIFTKHWNQYPQERCRLYAINNNSHNRVKGAIMKSIGVVKGVSDMHYLNPRTKRTQYLELKKYSGGRQSEEQKKFKAIVEADGKEYFLIRSIKDFNKATGLNIK